MEPPFKFRKTCIVIAGPTAVGKSAIAVQIAEHFNTAIISADSRQCYAELNIGVARPSEDLLKRVPHYFIADHSIQDEVTAARYESYALEVAHKLFEQHDVIVVTGGTGLYIKAFCEGLDDVQPPTIELRETLQKKYDQEGFDWLKNEITKVDPLFAKYGEMKNPRRILRALEVWNTTGKSIVEMHVGEPKQRDFNILSICLDLPREEMYQRINERVIEMVAQGLEKEARELQQFQHLNALQTVGYKEWFEYFEGKLSKDKTIDRIAMHTRHYAKRQITWFKKQQGMIFVEASFPAVIKTIHQKLKT